MGKQAEVVGKNLLDPGGHLFNKKKPAMAAAPAAAVEMPDVDSEAVAAARRRKLAAIKARGGRQSTVLAGDDMLGG